MIRSGEAISNLIMEIIERDSKIQTTGSIYHDNVQYNVYTDDRALVTRFKAELQKASKQKQILLILELIGTNRFYLLIKWDLCPLIFMKITFDTHTKVNLNNRKPITLPILDHVVQLKAAFSAYVNTREWSTFFE